MRDDAAELRRRAATIASRVTDETLRDPFWKDRFGARGREHTEKDAAYHVEYVAQAIEANDAEPMRRYAKWLQTLLTTRGMCTLHIDENFVRVSAAIGAELAEGHPGRAYLEEARKALAHEGVAREVADAGPAIVDALATTTPVARGELVTLLSFVADAVALRRPRTLGDHLAFLAASRGVDAPRLALALREAAVARGSPAVADAVRAMLEG